MASRAMRIDARTVVTSEAEPYVKPAATQIIDEAAIAARAYELWQARGCPLGSDLEDWFNAERQLKNRVPPSREVLSEPVA